MPPNAEYYRIELDYPLVMDEIARLMLTDSGGRLHDFVQGPPQNTGGVADHEGKHYTLRN